MAHGTSTIGNIYISIQRHAEKEEEEEEKEEDMGEEQNLPRPARRISSQAYCLWCPVGRGIQYFIDQRTLIDD